MLFKVDLQVLVPCNGGADLRRRLAEFGLLVGKEAFLGAGGTFGSMQPLEATPQAGMAQGQIAAAVAGKLVNHVADLGYLLVDVPLPGIAEIRPREFCAGQDGRQGAYSERCGGVVGRNVVGRIGPLRIAHGSQGECRNGQYPAALQHMLHKTSLGDILSGLGLK